MGVLHRRGASSQVPPGGPAPGPSLSENSEAPSCLWGPGLLATIGTLSGQLADLSQAHPGFGGLCPGR